MLDESLSLFQRSLDAPGKIILDVSHPRRAEPKRIEIETPFAVIGRSNTADIPLKGSDVSFRHAYMQPLMGGVFCVDLGSHHGTHWGERRQRAGWLSDEHAMSIGPYTITLVNASPSDSADSNPVDFSIDPLECEPGNLEDLPRFVLQVSDNEAAPRSFTIDRLITFIGRSSDCPIKLADDSVSRVHCSLVLTPTGLWVVDLLGKSGVTINGQPQRFAALEHGDRFAVGRYSIQIELLDSTDDLYEEAVQDEEEVLPSIAETVVDESETVLECEVAKPKRDEWLGSLFEIVLEGDTLVVMPNLSAGTFRYITLHSEANSLLRKFDECGVRHLVIDLQKMGYLGTEAIVALIKLARKATDSGGNAAFCRLSTILKEVLTNMGLLKLWPEFATREEALAAVQKD